MSVRHVVFAAVESVPRCPLKVVRLFPDGTEETFTRDLVWERSSTLGDALPVGAWETGPEYATAFLTDMVVETRAAKYGRPHADGFVYHALFRERADVLDLDACHGLVRRDQDEALHELTPDGSWQPCREEVPAFAVRRWATPGPAAVAIDAGEAARLAARGVRAPEPAEWHVIWAEDDAIPAGVVLVRADGSEEVFTRDLVWERSDLRHRTPVRVREATEPEARRAIGEMVRLMNLCRRRDEGGPYQYYGIFRDERDAVDLRNASQIIRQPRDNGRDPQVNRWRAETWDFLTEDGWTPHRGAAQDRRRVFPRRGRTDHAGPVRGGPRLGAAVVAGLRKLRCARRPPESRSRA
ncbi:hypothetical protein [Lentzea sp. NPDC055074]